MKKIVILYHKNCLDGQTSAWVAWKFFKNKADYLPVEHQKSIPADLKNKSIYCIDFCYSEDIMQSLLAQNDSLIVIDHHITAEKKLTSLPNAIYDINHSGCVLAWKYFFPKESLPRIIRHVEDVDLWKFLLPYTKEISAVLDAKQFSFSQWDKLAKDIEINSLRKQHIIAGKTILLYQSHIIHKLINQAQLVTFEKHKAYAVNSPVLSSEIGNALVQKDFSIGIIWSIKKDLIRVSLRSNGTVDVAKLAQQYGGGGHVAAAGFSLPLGHQLPWKVVSTSKR
ncbi:MAG: DHHA1 domain-containing protein [bacterium]